MLRTSSGRGYSVPVAQVAMPAVGSSAWDQAQRDARYMALKYIADRMAMDMKLSMDKAALEQYITDIIMWRKLQPAIFLAIAVVMMVVFCTLLAAGWYWLCCRDSDKSKNKPRCLSCVQTEVAPDQLALQEEEASPGPSTQDQLALQEEEASPGPSTQDQLALQEAEASPGPSTQDQLALQEEEASPGPSTQDQLALQEEEASPGPSTQDQLALQEEEASPGPSTQDQQGQREADGLAESPQ
nr:hypothetical protein BaRGS_006778 [Batillaria attramentaria]